MASFDHVAETFWATEYPADHPPLTTEMVADAERQLGVSLPSALVRLLRIRNGGVVGDAWEACPAPPNTWADDHVPFDQLLGIGPPYEAGGPLSLLDTAYLIEEWGLPQNIVLLSGDGHTWLALDYR